MFDVLKIARHAALAGGLAAALVAGSSVAAQGLRAPLDASYIVDHHANVARAYVEVAMVRSAVDGTLEIREDRHGAPGALLGQTTIHAGANPSVKVQLIQRPVTDLIAVLRAGDDVLATAEFERDF